MSEDIDDKYVSNTTTVLGWLRENGFITMCDISKKTLEKFCVKSVLELKTLLNIDMIRIDYGFSDDEIIDITKNIPIILNASTINFNININKLDNVYALHNFYPREYTGLSKNQFIKINKALEKNGIKTLAFLPNSKYPRKPIYEGLPTLEHQRYVNSFVNFIEFKRNFSIDGMLISDLSLDEYDIKLINMYENSGVIAIPCYLSDTALYDKVFTIRIDSPDVALRIQESREYATAEDSIEPYNCINRYVGDITRDNKHFLRYSNELQIIKNDLPKDYRVNVIGKIIKEYKNIVKYINNGDKIIFVKT